MILTLSGSRADLNHAEQDRGELNSLFDAVSEPVFLILDMTNAQLNFDELMRGASAAYRGDNPTFRHPNIRELLQVASDPTLKLAAEGLDNEVFGNAKVRLFTTLEEALEYARAAE